MPSFDIYGFTEENLEIVRSHIEDILEIVFDSHNSSYLGGDYYRHGTPNLEHFVLQRNSDLVDGEPIEPIYSTYPILLYVNRTERAEELTCLITKSNIRGVLLKHEQL